MSSSKYEARVKEAMRLLREARYIIAEVAYDMEEDADAGIKAACAESGICTPYALLMQQSGQMREASEAISHARGRVLQLRKNLII